MKFFICRNHKTSYEEINEQELFQLLVKEGPVTPAFLKLIFGQIVNTAEGDLIAIHDCQYMNNIQNRGLSIGG